MFNLKFNMSPHINGSGDWIHFMYLLSSIWAIKGFMRTRKLFMHLLFRVSLFYFYFVQVVWFGYLSFNNLGFWLTRGISIPLQLVGLDY